MEGFFRLFRKHRAEIAALGALILLAPVGLSILEQGLESATAALKVEAIAALERILDRDIRYSGMSPSVLLYVEIRDLWLTSRGGAALPSVRIGRLRVHYNLFRLLAGRRPVDAVTRVDVRDTSLDLGDLSTIRSPRRFDLGMLPASLQITGTNLSLSLIVDGAQVRVQRLFFAARRSGSQIGLQVTRASVDAAGASFAFRTQLRVTARTSTDLAAVDAVLRVDGLRSQTLSLSRQAFHIQREAGTLAVRRIRDKAPIDLQLTVDSVRARLAVRTENYNPRTLASFSGSLAFLNEYARASITATSFVEYAFADGALRYEAAVDAELGGRLLPEQTLLEARVEGDRRVMRFAPLAVRSPRGDLRFEGDLALTGLLPQGSLRLSEVAAFADKRIDASLDLERGDRSVILTGRRFEIGGSVFEDLHLTLWPSAGQLRFDAHAAIERGVHHRRTIAATGYLRSRPSPRLEFSTRARSVPLSLIARIAPVPAAGVNPLMPALTDLLVDADLTAATDFRTLVLDSQNLSVTDSVDPRNTLSMSLHYAGGRLRAEEIAAAWGGHVLSGSLELYNGPESSAFESALVVDGSPYRFSGTWDPSLGLLVSGSHDLRVAVQPLYGSYALNMAARDLPVPLRGPRQPPTRIDIALEGSWGGPRSWNVRVTRLVVRDFPFGAGGASRIEARFAASPRLISVERLSFADRLGEIANERPASFALRETLKGSLDLATRSGSERYSLSFDLGPSSFDAEMRVHESPLARVALPALTGNLNGLIRASGPYADPAVRTSLWLSGATISGQAATGSIEAAYSSGRLVLTSLESATRSYRIGPTSASYDLGSGRFEVETSLTGRSASFPVSSRLRLAGLVRPGPGISLWRALFRGELNGQVAVADLRPGRDVSASWILSFARVDDTLAFEGGPADSIRGYVAENGSFDLWLAKPLPLRGRASGSLKAAGAQTRIAGLEFDLAWLSSFLSGSFSFVHGTAYGIGDVILSGSLADPLWQGRLQARGVRMTYYMCPDVTSPFSADITLRDRDLVLEPARASVGPGELSAYGVIGFARWIPRSYDLQFKTGGAAGLHMVYDFGPVFVDGYASGGLRVNGDELAVRVTGDLEVDTCKLTLSQNEAAQAPAPERSTPFVDLQLTAGRRVEFFWPSVAFPVLRASARTGSRLRIEHLGDARQTRVVGRVALRGGDVFYINRSFYIKEGELAFNESDQRFDPRLTLRGEIRERDRAGEDVRIYLVVDDRRLSEFMPRFESDPPRSEVEIVALLGGPIEDQLVQGGLAGSAVLLSSDILSHFGLLRPFEQGVRDLLGLDLFSIRTQMIQNVVVDRVLGIEDPVVEPAADPLGRYFDNTTVTLGKYIGKDLFLAMDVRFSEKPTSGIDTEVQFSLDWPTPLFDLEWVISPGEDDLETFVRDRNRLSITWRYSY